METSIIQLHAVLAALIKQLAQNGTINNENLISGTLKNIDNHPAQLNSNLLEHTLMVMISPERVH